MTLRRSSLWITAVLCAVVSLLSGCVTSSVSRTDGKEIVTSTEEPDKGKRARARLELAAAYFSRGQLTVALDEVKIALEADPSMGEAYNLRGLIYGGLGDERLAIESFERALRINPNDGDAMHNYGWLMCQHKRFPEAEVLFQRAIALPNYFGTTRTLLASGVCQANAGLWPEAEATLTRAYERDPASPAIATNLAEVLLKRGEPERARFYIRRVNSVPNQSTSQTLWLAARIEMKLGNRTAANEYGLQLRNRFPQSRESAAFDRGQFNE